MTPEIKSDISDSSNEVIKSLALPASEQIGQALGNICGLINSATFPIKLANNYAKRNFEKYNERLNEIPKEKIKSVDPEIGIPLFEKLTYTSNEDLANAYANLLANASNIDKVNLIHPGFINKLNNLAPDEVKILELLKQTDDIPYIIFNVSKNNGNKKDLTLKLTLLNSKLGLDAVAIDTHLNNLISLNIINDKQGAWIASDSYYEPIIKHYSYMESTFKKKLENGEYGENAKNTDVEKSFYSITTLGKTFIEACTNTKNS